MSSNSTPKSVSLSPEPKASKSDAPAVPDYIKDLPEDAQVFVLVPIDDGERRAVVEQLEGALLKYFAEPPKYHHELKVARLPYGSFLYVAHCTTARAKRPDGTFGQVSTIHIGGPIDLKTFSQRSADGYTWTVDTAGIIDATIKACKHTNGTVWLPALSGDTVAEQRVLKLTKA